MMCALEEGMQVERRESLPVLPAHGQQRESSVWVPAAREGSSMRHSLKWGVVQRGAGLSRHEGTNAHSIQTLY